MELMLSPCREMRILISNIEFDSRKVTAGSLFVAVRVTVPMVMIILMMLLHQVHQA